MMMNGDVVMQKSFTTAQLIEQLYTNLRFVAPKGQEHAYIAGYIYNVLKDVAEGGVDELTANVDWTNQRVEAKRKAELAFFDECCLLAS
jgi:hypothetical protein